jgi:hypothetical protein
MNAQDIQSFFSRFMGISDLLVENALAAGHWGICRRRRRKIFLCA